MTVVATLMRVSVAMVAVANMLLISPIGHLSAYCPTGSSMRAPRVSRHPRSCVQSGAGMSAPAASHSAALKDGTVESSQASTLMLVGHGLGQHTEGDHLLPHNRVHQMSAN